MYFNKLLFPAPHSSYQLKQLENELIWVTREKHLKGFKIDRKEVHKSEEKTKTHTPYGSKLIKFFKYNKSSKEDLKKQKIINTLNLETGSANKRPIALNEIEIFHEAKEDPDIKKPIPKFLKKHIIKNAEMTKSPNSLPPLKHPEEIDSDSKKDENKIKKKKKKGKAMCLSFFPRINKNKKITLEMFDGTNEAPGPFGLNEPTALKNLGPEIAHAIFQQNNQMETEKESSSDSDDEPSATDPKKTVNIPCLYLKSRIPTPKHLLYFHGNGEDLYTSYGFFHHLTNNLMINLIAIEYPGYGIYSGSSSEKKVLRDAEAVYNHLLNNLKIKEEDIFIFGRSIGTGPATWLASVKNPGLLILMSPFTSIRAVAKHIGGNLAKYLVKQRFNNLEFMEDVKCPVFIIHGKRDTLIPPTQAVQLYDAVKGVKKIHLADDMTHSDFDFFGDVTVPLTSWFKELNLFNFDKREHDFNKIKDDTLLTHLEDVPLTKQSSSKMSENNKSVH